MILMAVGPPVLAGAWFMLPRMPLNVRIFGVLIGIHVWLALAAFAVALGAGIRRRSNASRP
jgi:hypothetical protein